MLKKEQIEQIENKYLNQFFYLMKSLESEMMKGFQTKERIKDDWKGKYGTNISDFAVGAERIIYSLLNGKAVGQPNSSPVGSDMFFETEDAFIHIDLKTVQTKNIGDYNTSIFVGRNQNSYKGKMIVRSGGEEVSRDYEPALPTFYNKGKENEKICLSYFITILYEAENLSILNINIICMPNGELSSVYSNKVLKAGKNPDKTRFNFSKVSKFELLDDRPSRIKVVFFDKNMDPKYRKKLKFIEEVNDN
jgi:hypothetical protein